MLTVSVFSFVIAFYIPALYPVVTGLFIIFIGFVLVDYSLLFFTKKLIHARRITPHRLSNGDENNIEIVVKNPFDFMIKAEIVDELPEQFQLRNWKRDLSLKARQQKKIRWKLKPLQRGEYHFGDLHLFISSPINLISRRFTIKAAV